MQIGENGGNGENGENGGNVANGENGGNGGVFVSRRLQTGVPAWLSKSIEKRRSKEWGNLL